MKSRVFLYISLGVDISIAILKFIAAAFTGSSSMLSEGIHSVIDAVSQLLLIWGVKASTRQPDKTRPFGYGKELYFWSFIVSLVIFVVGGCISFYEGFLRFEHPDMIGNPVWNYAILLLAFIFNTISLVSALKAFNKERGRSFFWNAIIRSKDPSTFIVMLGDVGDLVGLVIAFLGIFLGRLFHNNYFDGIASMLIGTVLLIIAGLLLRESKSLLMGETIGRKNLHKIVLLTEADTAVIKVKKHFSMYMGPEEVLLHINTVFEDNLTTKQITDAIERITKSIQTEFPRIKQIFIEPVAK
ncbi:cation diffusion facilitator family transporter [Mucilaginibacter frigoritolerans]|uniref:Cation diffusion facilitator family transporter n=1 Tax=Mucilaginibacter frigoritolerans TaxID=652788 RepID=A0A562TT42_9SPHI|nr:cation diffusion facilitator family transporter [Mucilaginibacter frigoritolerans]TWI96789.1 cation diffusion facilitator family transporter [Mucilaginibacter frigoritolerans]